MMEGSPWFRIPVKKEEKNASSPLEPDGWRRVTKLNVGNMGRPGVNRRGGAKGEIWAGMS